MKTIVRETLGPYLTGMLMVAAPHTGLELRVETEDSKLESSIEAINDKFAEAFRSGSADNLSTYYMVVPQLMPPGMAPISGRDQILAYWQGAMSAGIGNVRLQTSAVSDQATRSLNTATTPFLQAKTFTVDKGKYIVIWKRWQPAQNLPRHLELGQSSANSQSC
ncbi:MAG: hypothetical protein R2758_11865 [Bacteroidales bacterium]